jgi:hypothetical protein
MTLKRILAMCVVLVLGMAGPMFAQSDRATIMGTVTDRPYVTYRSSSIGGSYPGAPNASTPFPSETLIDHVRIYSN